MQRRRLAAWFGVGIAFGFAVLATPLLALAQPIEVGAPPNPPLRARPAWIHPLPPVGEEIRADTPRPTTAGGVLCSLRQSVCVHASADVPEEQVRSTLAIAERAAISAGVHLGLPAPAFDGTRGGSSAFDFYIVQQDWPYELWPDAHEGFSPWDRITAFATLRDGLRGIERERAVAEAYLHGVFLGIDARSASGWRRALAASLATQVRGLLPDLAAIDVFARRAGRSLFANDDLVASRGAAFFVDALAERHDTAERTLLRGLLHQPIGRTEPESPRWGSRPNVFDGLGRALRSEPGGLAGLLIDTTFHRALAGTQGDRLRIVPPRSDGAFGIAPIARVDISRTPHYVLADRGVDITGCAAVVVDTSHAGAQTLNVWFHGVPWRQWAVGAMRLDARGQEIGRAPHVPVDRGEWSTAMGALETVHSILLVVVDLGGSEIELSAPPAGADVFALNFARSVN